MISYWLHQNPEEKVEAWAAQVAQAIWMERRYFDALGKVIHGKGKG